MWKGKDALKNRIDREETNRYVGEVSKTAKLQTVMLPEKTEEKR